MSGTWRRALRIGGSDPARTGAAGLGATCIQTVTVNQLASVRA